jgi:hypothetical protein
MPQIMKHWFLNTINIHNYYGSKNNRFPILIVLFLILKGVIGRSLPPPITQIQRQQATP